jgi:TRAP-type C4-dicarboxylate transport system substrate-binding protein
MMRRTGLRALAAAVTAASLLAVTACAGGGDPAPTTDPGTLEDMEPIVLRVSDQNPETASNVVALEKWMDYVREETGGKVDFETYYSGTLHSASEGLTALESGLTDITLFFAGYFRDELPIANWSTTSFSGAAGDLFPLAGLANGIAQSTLYEESEDLRAELAQYNAVPLAMFGQHENAMLCTEPVDSLESARGKLVTNEGEPWTAEVQALGMTNESVAYAEIYEALQRGVIDCVLTSPSVMMSLGLWEVAKYYVPTKFAPSFGAGWAFNKETWDSLPLEVRQIMHDGKAIISAGFVETATERFAVWADDAPGMGVEFVNPATEMIDTLDALRADTIARVGETAPSTATDPQRDLDIFVGAMEVWQARLSEELGIESAATTDQNRTELYLSTRDIDWAAYRALFQEALSEYRPGDSEQHDGE